VRYVQARDRSGGEWDDLVTSDVGFSSRGPRRADRRRGLRRARQLLRVLESAHRAGRLQGVGHLDTGRRRAAQSRPRRIQRHGPSPGRRVSPGRLGAARRLPVRGETDEDLGSVGVGWTLPGPLTWVRPTEIASRPERIPARLQSRGEFLRRSVRRLRAGGSSATAHDPCGVGAPGTTSGGP